MLYGQQLSCSSNVLSTEFCFVSYFLPHGVWVWIVDLIVSTYLPHFCVSGISVGICHCISWNN